METYTQLEQKLIEKVRKLSPAQVIEVENFIDFLCQRKDDRYLTFAAAKLSESILANIWDNPNDAEYDEVNAALSCVGKEARCGGSQGSAVLGSQCVAGVSPVVATGVFPQVEQLPLRCSDFRTATVNNL